LKVFYIRHISVVGSETVTSNDLDVI
jgi:hypothetical protein